MITAQHPTGQVCAHDERCWGTSRNSIKPTLIRLFLIAIGGSLTLFSAVANSQGTVSSSYALGSPTWTQDLVIYEIAPKGFTSPRGPASGTFRSLQEKLQYLSDLGITGIWLSGHSLADPHHFYNVWTQYAVVEPEEIDPTLGTPGDFKALVDAAHERGIKVFLDVVDHGVMSSSSLFKNHPQWFRGGSWGMVDFDYLGGHTDFDTWWVQLWANFVTRYGVDGFRLDTDTPRPDLWARIREKAVEAGHPIVIWEEDNGTIPGVTDFSQQDNRLFHVQWADSGLGEFKPRIKEPAADKLLMNDVAGYIAHQFGREGDYTVEIQYADGSKDHGSTQGDGSLSVRLDGLGPDKASRRLNNDFSALPDGVADVQLTVGNVATKTIQTVHVFDDNNMSWIAGGTVSPSAAVEGRAPKIRLYLATHTQGSSLLLSCHDNGWEGFPEGRNPFSAHGSRALFGYSFLFTPMLPIFMSGEEFDAEFHALPDLSPNLFGGDSPGHGRWLYGLMLDWRELRQADHQAMYADVRRMLRIRREHSNILRAIRGDIDPAVVRVPYSSNHKVPEPYMRWEGRDAILVAGNYSEQSAATLMLRLPLERLGWAGYQRFTVIDLWNERTRRNYSAAALRALKISLRPDKTPRGGLAVLEITASP